MNTPPPATATDRPASPLAVFIAFSLLALQGLGGVLAVAQRELVDRRNWLSRAEFVELYAVAQLLPGPNVVNLSLMIGDRYFGWRGAFAAIGGMLLAPMLVVLALAASYRQLAQYPAVAGALQVYQQHNRSQVADVQRGRRGVEADVSRYGLAGRQVLGRARHGIVVHPAPGQFV